ncbi:hypothetical protein HBI81_170870 [Parastagonospora nodorum]|nr:hypothetical protein HBH51_030850 [Parastagonospora nodorum]KAH4211099.1 hypothetical protein HBI95_051840 [Parastagonospora nodorum]KAH4296373.1 hypothetical protein HBI01_146970 [Parastagonospora nodorum]KAH4305089.1 hypothetical protein HBI02_127850 [Parastagonospora nodorum]KAH4338883.1 hypothetical protein HBI00_010670 [Parastagonospora nodorum]
MSALISHAQHAAGTVGTQLQRTAGSVGTSLQTTTNRLLPPQQREQKLKDLRVFANRNPKLATFLSIQTFLLGIPTLLFLTFALSTLLISLSTCLLIALISAFIYTGLAVGFALLFLVPTLFIASFAASCAFLWGLAVYLVLQRFNEGEAPGKPGTRVGDKLHGLTGGRLGWMVDGADDKPVQVGQAQNGKGTNGSTGHEGGRGASGEEGDGMVNGNGWESKWAMGMKPHRENADGQEIKVDTVTIPPTS